MELTALVIIYILLSLIAFYQQGKAIDNVDKAADKIFEEVFAQLEVARKAR